MPRSWPVILTLLIAAAGGSAAETLPVAYFTRPSDLGRMEISPDGKFLAATSIISGTARLTFIDIEHPETVTDIVAPVGMDFHDFQWISPTRVIYRLGVLQPGLEHTFTTGELRAVDRDGTNPQYVYGCRYLEEEEGGGGARESGLRMSRRLTMPKVQQVAAEEPSPESKDEAKMACGTAELLSTLAGDDRRILAATYPWRDEGGVYRYDADATPSLSSIDTYDGTEQVTERVPLRGAKLLLDDRNRLRFAAGRDEKGAFTIRWREPDGEWKSFVLSDFSLKDFVPVKLAKDGHSALVIARQNNNVRKALWRINLRSEAAEKVYEHSEVDVESVVEDLAGTEIIGLRVETDRPAFHWLQPDHPTAKLYETVRRAFPKQAIEITSVTDDHRRAVVLVQSDVNPGDYYLLDTQTRNAQYLRSARSWVDPAKMRGKESILLKARDGLLLHGYLTRPSAGSEPYPLVVLVRSSPFGEREHWDYDWEAQLLANYGYAVLQVNYRGSGGYGDVFMRAGYREWGGRMQNDLTDATMWAITQGIAQNDNICIFGKAYGGYAAMMGLVREPTLYRCGVGYDGLYDLGLVLAPNDPTVTPAARAYLDEVLGNDPKEVLGRSPLYYTERIQSPILLLTNDQTPLEIEHARRMWTTLNQAGKEAESAMAGSPEVAYTRVLEFLARHLRGGTAPAPLPAPAAAPQPQQPPAEQPKDEQPKN
jgi:dipeptidyl aminopeptidase/acylaminoacyl peptidase